ncbi:614/534 cytochrome P450 [Coprinopsis sp. MPI-PUGE-AT-0042]|nr:614/534 cytochrome P450 [Coprinopsis sp. MPI-PUGE-AT-0042]
MASGYLLVASLLVIAICERFLSYWTALQAVNHHPGHRRAFSANSILGMMMPPMRGINTGPNHLLIDGFKPFKYFGWDVIVDVSWLGQITTIYTLADAGAVKEVTSSRAKFPKPTELYGALSIYGDNILTTEGELWRRYKKLTAPAFNDRNNKLVWVEAVRVIADLFDEVWQDQKEIEVEHCLELTLPIALYILGAAVFGNKVSWKEDSFKPPGHQLTFKEALHHSSENLLIKAAAPNWALGLTAQLRLARLAFKELGMYMNEMLQERISSQNADHSDLFSVLLASSMGEAKDENLTGDEILGNTFIFLVAGHETTAHTLCFTFALLALYEEEQEKLYQHISSVLPDKRLPAYEDMPSLTRTMAVFYETLRLFPPVTGIPKVAAEDTTLTIGNQLGETMTVPVPKGTHICIDSAALHRNPKYWPDPEEFKPDRFMAPDWPRDAFLPFSGGARACLGRKFFETEGIAALTMIISRYKVTVKDEPQFSGETFAQKRARVTANKAGVTVTPLRVPLVFTRRD